MSSDNIAEQLEKLLTDYNKEVTEATEKVGKEIADETAEALKARSPQNRPEYYKGWTAKKNEKSAAGSEFTVYNSTHPGLTHLLERGHAVVNQGGSTGKRAKAQRHIKPVENEKTNEYYERLVEEVSGIK